MEYADILYAINHNTQPYNWTDEYREHERMIRKAIELQIEKPTIKREIDEDIIIEVCPTCGNFTSKVQRNCHQCGQRIRHEVI